MGNGLSKEQEQCFKLIQQPFKAAGVSLMRIFRFRYMGKSRAEKPSYSGKLRQKRKGPMGWWWQGRLCMPAGPFLWVAPAAAGCTA